MSYSVKDDRLVWLSVGLHMCGCLVVGCCYFVVCMVWFLGGRHGATWYVWYGVMQYAYVVWIVRF